jgi:hypothetical protein
MQMLMPDDGFNPIAKHRPYVPVLQTHKGERSALSQVEPSDWSNMTPVMQIVGDRDAPDELTDSRVRGWTKNLADAVGAHAFFIDVVRLRPDLPVAVKASKVPVLRRVHERLRARALTFVPVYREEWASPDIARIVSDADAEDGRGVAIRLNLRGGVSAAGATFADRATAAAKMIEVPASRTDLFLDVGHVDRDAEPDVEGIAAAVQGVASGGWRNLVLTATTMPSSLGGGIVPPGATVTFPRHEWNLWRAVARKLTPVVVAYGDYAIQHPTPPHEKGGPGMRPNVRYTTDSATVVVRGVESVLTGGNEQYPGLCEKLIERKDFAGPDFSWGDHVIAGCAAGEIPPGGQSMWRGAGTSHHLRHVLTQLAEDAR